MRQKVSGFLDNLIWIGNGKFSLLLREVSDLIKNNFFLLYFAQNSEKIG